MGLCRDCHWWVQIPTVPHAPPPPLVNGEQIAMCVLTLRHGREMVDRSSKAMVIGRSGLLPDSDEEMMLVTQASFGCVQFEVRDTMTAFASSAQGEMT